MVRCHSAGPGDGGWGSGWKLEEARTPVPQSLQRGTQPWEHLVLALEACPAQLQNQDGTSSRFKPLSVPSFVQRLFAFVVLWDTPGELEHGGLGPGT